MMERYKNKKVIKKQPDNCVIGTISEPIDCEEKCEEALKGAKVIRKFESETYPWLCYTAWKIPNRRQPVITYSLMDKRFVFDGEAAAPDEMEQFRKEEDKLRHQAFQFVEPYQNN